MFFKNFEYNCGTSFKHTTFKMFFIRKQKAKKKKNDTIKK